MAQNKKRKISLYAKKLLTSLSPINSTTTKKKNEKLINTYFKLSKDEANKIVQESYVPSDVTNFNKNNLLGSVDIFKPIQMNIVKKKYDYSKITKLVPELEQASLIVIPSILSPNSFRNYVVTYYINLPESKLETNVNNKICELINEHVNNNLKFNDKIESWIKEALYRTGAKPILVIPAQTLNSIRNKSISFEELDVKNVPISNEALEDLKDAIVNDDEILNLKTDLFNDLSQMNKNNSFNSKIDTTIVGMLENINDEISKKDLIKFTDNCSALSIAKEEKQDTNKMIMEKYQKYFNTTGVRPNVNFKNESVLSLDDYYDSSINESHPIIDELPTESVIPLYAEGIPENHIHYLVLLDENGNPISISNEAYEEYIETTISNECPNDLNKLYKNVFGNKSSSFNSSMKNVELYKTIYKFYLDNLIKNNLKGIGLSKLSLSFNNEINKIMLYRLFKHKKTRIVFVPSVLMTYFAFDYNDDGTGRSKLEDILFPLSLKITYLITKTVNLMEQAIHRQNVKVDLDETVGNPLEILQAIKEKLIEGKVSEISYDPIKIIKNIAEREIRITPTNIPGINQFSIDPETYTSNKPMPDETLIEEANNLINLNLDVPPSAFNRLSEDEYSRSILTNNILFSKKIELRQKKVIKHMSNLIRSYLLFDNVLKEKIIEIIKKEKTNLKTEKLNDYVFNIIQHVTLTLPTLRIAHDKADFEEVGNYIGMIESLMEKLFPSELISDRDNQEIFATIVSMLKADIIKKYLVDSHISKYIDNTILNIDESFDITKVTDINQFVSNTKKALDDIKKKLVKEEGGGY